MFFIIYSIDYLKHLTIKMQYTLQIVTKHYVFDLGSYNFLKVKVRTMLQDPDFTLDINWRPITVSKLLQY